MGKVDEHGNVAEDLRSQILGQLSERVNYQQLYAQALSDPELKRTRLELDAAMNNAEAAKDAVFELFQDLDRFSLDDYAPLSDTRDSIQKLVAFITSACELINMKFRHDDDMMYTLLDSSENELTKFTTDREIANQSENLNLIGLDHPIVEKMLREYKNLPAETIGLIAQSPEDKPAVLSLWEIETHNSKGHEVRSIIKIAVDDDGNRIPSLEKNVERLFSDYGNYSATKKSGVLRTR